MITFINQSFKNSKYPLNFAKDNILYNISIIFALSVFPAKLIFLLHMEWETCQLVNIYFTFSSGVKYQTILCTSVGQVCVSCRVLCHGLFISFNYFYFPKWYDNFNLSLNVSPSILRPWVWSSTKNHLKHWAANIKSVIFHETI